MTKPLLPPFSVTLPATAFSVRNALEQVLTELDPLALDREETGAIELVLAEVLNNIVEHAYADDDLSGEIKLTCKHAPEGLLVTITDQGAAMPDDGLPSGSLKSNDVALEDLPEGGFGWFLIQHLAKDMVYQRVANENRLNLRLAIGKTV